MNETFLAEVDRLAQSIYALRARRVPLEPGTRRRIGERDGWICSICGEKTDPGIPWDYSVGDWEGNDEFASVEHVVPVCMGGDNEDGNLAIAHLRCNRLGSPATRHQIRAAQAATEALKALPGIQMGSEGYEALQDSLVTAAYAMVDYLVAEGRWREIPQNLLDEIDRMETRREILDARRLRDEAVRERPCTARRKPKKGRVAAGA